MSFFDNLDVHSFFISSFLFPPENISFGFVNEQTISVKLCVHCVSVLEKFFDILLYVEKRF